jgi:hypothetical protein
MALGSTQDLTEMSTRNLPGGKGRPARKAENLCAVCLENMEASTFHNPMGLDACYKDGFTLFLPTYYLFYLRTIATYL